MIVYVTELLAVLLVITAVAVIRVHDLFALILLLSVYSGLFAVILAVMGAPDVAFTEAVVGTSVSTIFFMALMWRVNPLELTRWPAPRRLLAWVPALAIGALLLYGINALPEFGSAASPPTVYLSPEYIERAYHDTHTPNVVTAILADYRSFDTLIETAVVLTAALACLLVLQRKNDPTV
jgi:multicomponent Na+:H+ antiporter subunit B